LKTYVAYQKARFKEALKRSWQDFAPTREHVVLYASISIVAFVLQGLVLGWDSVKNDLALTLLQSVGAIAATYIMWLLVCVGLAPYRLWMRDRQRQKDEINREKHARIAKELERCIQKGNRMLSGFSTLAGAPDVPGWRKEAEEIVAKCGDDELAMFRTLYPENVMSEDEDGVMTAFNGGPTERDVLKGSIAKLRKIMSRQLQLAKATT
jgi:hypothetical protein